MKNINKKSRLFIFILIILSVILFVLFFTGCTGKSSIPYDYKQGFKIIFCSNMNGQYDLYSLDIDSNKLTQLTNTATSDYHPSFSPDGTKIVYVSFGENGDDEELFTMNSDGTNVIRITDNEFNEDDPLYNADATRIIYVSDRYKTDINNAYPVSGIYISDVDGSNEKILKDMDRASNGYDPCISPDGQHLLFSSSWSYDDEIYLMDIYGGSGIVNLTNSLGWDGRPAFSPDGTKIAFSSTRNSTQDNADIYIMDSSGSNVLRLTDNDAYNTDPAFSPDGKFIVFYSDQDGDYDIYMMGTDGNNIINLTNNSSEDYYPCFYPE